MDTYEGQDVSTFDVPGAYFNADIPNDKYASLKLEGEFMDIMCNMNPYQI